jgi:hypothetical protein
VGRREPTDAGAEVQAEAVPAAAAAAAAVWSNGTSACNVFTKFTPTATFVVMEALSALVWKTMLFTINSCLS